MSTGCSTNASGSEIADLLNGQGIGPGGAVRPGCADARFTASRVAYLARSYGLRSRYDRLRDQGMLTKAGRLRCRNTAFSTGKILVAQPWTVA